MFDGKKWRRFCLFKYSSDSLLNTRILQLSYEPRCSSCSLHGYGCKIEILDAPQLKRKMSTSSTRDKRASVSLDKDRLAVKHVS